MIDRVAVKDVTKIYRLGTLTVTALAGVSLTVRTGEFLAVAGPSGSGKTTLLNLIGCLDTPTRGEYLLDGRPIHEFNDDGLAEIRNTKIGFVFQAPYLIPFLDVTDNVALLPMLAGRPNGEARKRAIELLEDVRHNLETLGAASAGNPRAQADAERV